MSEQKTLIEMIRSCGDVYRHVDTNPFELSAAWISVLSHARPSTTFGKAIRLLDSKLCFDTRFEESVATVRMLLNSTSEQCLMYAEMYRSPGSYEENDESP